MIENKHCDKILKITNICFGFTKIDCGPGKYSILITVYTLITREVLAVEEFSSQP